MTPQMLMYTLGHDFVPAGIHAGGLRYHGDSPLVSQLVHEGEAEAIAVDQTACFDAAVQFARAEGILPAPESSHAIRAAIDEALAAQEAGEDRIILFNLSGHGHFDLAAYAAYNAGELRGLRLRRRRDALRRRPVGARSCGRPVLGRAGAPPRRPPRTAGRSRGTSRDQRRSGTRHACSARGSRSVGSPRAEDAAAAVAAGADAVGVIFAPSPRQVTLDAGGRGARGRAAARGARRRVRGRAAEEVVEAVAACGSDRRAVQRRRVARALRRGCPCPVIKAFRVGTDFGLDERGALPGPRRRPPARHARGRQSGRYLARRSTGERLARCPAGLPSFVAGGLDAGQRRRVHRRAAPVRGRRLVGRRERRRASRTTRRCARSAPPCARPIEEA